MDEQACRRARERLFEGTLLKEGEPVLFSRLFCKHPVIRLGLKLSTVRCPAIHSAFVHQPPGTAAVECFENPRWRASQDIGRRAVDSHL
ncbi:hypothetical protein GQ54DRAFT_112036 [Martensiomyces pterosporus]|nr:hypothetical protein GQ54DRAFT_112036 [Martensiomyces pterosporus]